MLLYAYLLHTFLPRNFFFSSWLNLTRLVAKGRILNKNIKTSHLSYCCACLLTVACRCSRIEMKK